MSKSNTPSGAAASPIEEAQAEIKSARAIAGGEGELTPDDRKQIVIALTKAVRALKKIARDYVPREAQA